MPRKPAQRFDTKTLAPFSAWRFRFTIRGDSCYWRYDGKNIDRIRVSGKIRHSAVWSIVAAFESGDLTIAESFINYFAGDYLGVSHGWAYCARVAAFAKVES